MREKNREPVSRYPLEADQREQMDKLQLKDAELQPIREECLRQSLPDGAFTVLVWRSIELADFERQHRTEIKTESQMLQSLRAVEDAAAMLRNAIEHLSSGEFIGLDHELVSLHFPKATDTEQMPDLAVGRLSPRSIQAQRFACQIATAARAARWRHEQNGADGKGRKKLLPAYAGHIAKLACQLKPFDLVPGDGGPFRRLCDAVWEVAGVRATSQGAIVYFGKNERHRLKSLGFCL